ncbi:MAG: response regulator [Lachnospiraceae bacterium]|nr:response regulator [Lachnospiraceae bacterium]
MKLQDKILYAEKLFLVLFFACSLIFAFAYSAKDKIVVVEDAPLTYIESWTVTDADGTVFTTGRYYVGEEKKEGDYEIAATLPDDVTDNMVLFFKPCYQNRVYINGELREDYDLFRDEVIPGGPSKSLYLAVPLYASDAGGELRMVRQNSTSKGPEMVPETMVTTMSGAYGYMSDHWGITFFLAAVLFVFSLTVMVVGLYMYFLYRQTIDMFYGAFAVMVISLWVMTNNYLYPFVFRHYHIDGILNYMMCLLIPLGLIIYLDSIQKGRHRKYMISLMIFSTVNTLFWTLLHFAGIFNFGDALLYIDIMLGIIVVAGIAMLVKEYREKRTKEYRYTAIGFVGFLACCVVEIIIITFFTVKNDSIPMVVGLTVLLVFVVMQQVDDLRTVGIEKQKAIDMSEAKSNFLASMSHEIRTPINSILGMNEMILRESRDEAITDYARTVDSSGKMLLMLVNDILDFSKIEAGKMEITNTKYSLSSVLFDVCAIVKERAVEKGLDFDVRIHDGVPDGQFSDEFRIRQILINYTNNAIKYTDKGSVTLTVGGTYENDDTYRLKLSVKDTGRGIKKEDQEHLFDAFSRADISKNRNIEGTGLGLAIVKNVADSLDGTVGVESEYGRGSLFYVDIPVEVFDRTPVTLLSVREAKGDVKEESHCDYTAPDARILAVDDNRANLKIVSLFLKRIGATVDLAGDGNSALKACEETAYDLLLLDHMMPQPDGIETLKMIRESASSQNKTTPAIVLTANAVAGSRKLYMDAGFADYLTKPLNSETLEKTVEKFLPEEKVVRGGGFEVLEFDAEPETSHTDGQVGLKDKLSAIEGLDYDLALIHCAGEEEMLKEIISEIVKESAFKIVEMEESLKKGDLDSYRVVAHSIKGLMSTIGLKELSEHAKRHEFAVKESNTQYINEDSTAFIEEYRDVCGKLKDAIG